MDPLPQRFLGRRMSRRMSSGFSRPGRFGPTSPAHRSFHLTRPAKEKVIGRTMEHGYVTQNAKKELSDVEERIARAVGRGDKTFIDAHGVEHKISDQMRYFAKEAREGGHTLTKASEVKKFAEGLVETTREEGIELRSGYNIGSKREVAGTIVKAEESTLEPELKHTAQQDRREHRAQLDQIRTRIGLPTSQSTGSLAAPSAPSIQEPQSITPATSNAPAPAKATSALHAPGLINPNIIGGRYTDTQDRPDEPIVATAPSDPLAEENQAVADSIPPAQDVDLPDTSNVDRGLPF